MARASQLTGASTHSMVESIVAEKAADNIQPGSDPLLVGHHNVILSYASLTYAPDSPVMPWCPALNSGTVAAASRTSGP